MKEKRHEKDDESDLAGARAGDVPAAVPQAPPATPAAAATLSCPVHDATPLTMKQTPAPIVQIPAAILVEPPSTISISSCDISKAVAFIYDNHSVFFFLKCGIKIIFGDIFACFIDIINAADCCKSCKSYKRMNLFF